MFIRKIFFKIKRKIFYFRHKFYPEQLRQQVDSTLFFVQNPRPDFDYKSYLEDYFKSTQDTAISIQQLRQLFVKSEGRIVPVDSPAIDIDFGGTVNGI